MLSIISNKLQICTFYILFANCIQEIPYAVYLNSAYIIGRYTERTFYILIFFHRNIEPLVMLKTHLKNVIAITCHLHHKLQLLNHLQISRFSHSHPQIMQMHTEKRSGYNVKLLQE